MASIGYIEVDNVELPSPSANGLTVSYNKVWSTNAGRTATASMVGSIVAVKKKLEITYNVLTPAQMKLISDVMDTKTAFHTVKYYDIASSSVKSFKGYFGDGSYPIYGTNIHGDVIITGVKISIIEK